MNRLFALCHLPRIARLYVLLVLLNVVAFSILRAVFYAVFAAKTDSLSGAILARAFYIGSKFDLRLAVIVNLPVLLLGWIGRIDPFESTLGRRLWTVYLLVANVAVQFLYVCDFGHYAYLQSHLNVTALQYLRDFAMNALMVWQTYPVLRISLGLAALAAGLAWIVRVALRAIGAGYAAAPARGWRRAVAASAVALLSAAGIYGKLAHYPLRWSDAYFAVHPFAADVALNPVLYFQETLKRKAEPYDLKKVRENYDFMAKRLGVDKPDAQSLTYTRFVNRPGALSGKPNVIVVMLESFCFFKTGLSGNPLDPTPNFDAVARKGILFKRFYVASPGSARSVFTTVTGLPDLEARGTSTRNPLLVSQHTIVNCFEGYAKFFFLGGSLNWANIRGLLAHNIPGLSIYEEGSYTAPRVDVWGISDLCLLEEANQVFRKQQQPFFAIVETSGNHRPYTIPEDKRGFELRTLPESELTKYGFKSNEEFNSFRFMDHSVGFFMNTATNESYFRNTVFVFYGDHGLPGNAAHMPPSEDRLGLSRFHVPLLIYAPGSVEGGTVRDDIASEMDVLPTIAGLTSTPYLNSTLGVDLLDPALDKEHCAFTVHDQSRIPEIGAIGKDFYFRMYADGAQKRLHDLGAAEPIQDTSALHPDEAARLEALCRATFETARYMPYVNAPDKVRR